MLTVQRSMQKMTPFLPFFEQNRLYFIILLPSFLSAKGSHLVMFDGASVFVCAWREAGVFRVWIPELCEKDRFLWGWI